MPDISVVIFVVLGAVLLGAGIILIVGRLRVAKNMEAAGVIPARVESSVTHVVVLGAGQLVLGALSLVGAGVMANRDAFGQFHRALGRMLQVVGLNGGVAGIVALLVGLALVAAGILLLSWTWRSRSEWVEARQSIRLSPEASRRISAGTALCALGAIATVLGGVLLAGALIS